MKRFILLFVIAYQFGSVLIAQNHIVIWDDNGTELFRKDYFDSSKIFQLKSNDLFKQPVEGYFRDYRMYIYFGKKQFEYKELKKHCNSFSIDNSCLDNPIFMEYYREMKKMEEDTFCIPTGIDSLPDGFWAIVTIDSGKMKPFCYYTIKDFKINGRKYKGVERDTIIYKNGFLVYSSGFYNDSTYNIAKYNECGKVKEHIYVEEGKILAYDNAYIGIGVYFNRETGNIQEMCTLKKNVIHGKFYIFNEDGSIKKIEEYEYGKKIEGIKK
jgi:hypothetical protein